MAAEPFARLYRRLKLLEAALTGSCVIEIEPIGDFLISRVGLPLWKLRDAAAQQRITAELQAWLA